MHFVNQPLQCYFSRIYRFFLVYNVPVPVPVTSFAEKINTVFQDLMYLIFAHFSNIYVIQTDAIRSPIAVQQFDRGSPI